MRENTGLTIACFIISLSLFVLQFFKNSLLGGALVLGIIIIWLGLSSLSIYRVFTKNNLQWKRRVVPFYLILLPVFVLALITFINKVLYESDWFIATAYSFTGSDEFRLKENGNFEYWHNSPLGALIIAEGQYTQKDSTIALQSSKINKFGGLHGFIMRPYIHRDEQPNKAPIILIPLDKQGQRVDSLYFYADRKYN